MGRLRVTGPVLQTFREAGNTQRVFDLLDEKEVCRCAKNTYTYGKITCLTLILVFLSSVRNPVRSRGFTPYDLYGKHFF